MRTLAWMALQIAVVAWWVWVEYDEAAFRGRSAEPLHGFAMGIFFAFIVTAGIVAARDGIGRLVSSARRARAGRAVTGAAVAPAAAHSEIAQPRHQGTNLPAPGFSEQLPEPRRRLGHG
jgi:hypothetical protein